jgi:hypothetical protein
MDGIKKTFAQCKKEGRVGYEGLLNREYTLIVS